MPKENGRDQAPPFGKQPSKVLIKDKNLREKYVQLPRPVLRAKGLTMKAKLVYALLLDYAWDKDYIFPGQETMAQDLEVSVDTIQRAIKELREYQLISYKQTGLNMPNIYYIEPLDSNPNLSFKTYAEEPNFEQEEENRGGNRKKRFPETAKSGTNTETAKSGTKETKETKIERNEVFRKANALKTEKEENGQIPARSHRARRTIRKRKEEEKENTGGVTHSQDNAGTNKRDVQGRAQQATPRIPEPAKQKNTGEGGSTRTKTNGVTPTQKRVAKIEAAKNRQPAYIGKPLTQDEIDEKRRNNRNASGLTPLASSIPASHWQELQARAAAHPTNDNGNGHHTGAQNGESNANDSKKQGHWKDAPLFLQATIAEWFSLEMHDQAIHSSITRAYRLYQSFDQVCRSANPDLKTEDIEGAFYQKMQDARGKAKRSTPTVKTPDGRGNRMPLFFACLEEVLGLKERSPN